MKKYFEILLISVDGMFTVTVQTPLRQVKLLPELLTAQWILGSQLQLYSSTQVEFRRIHVFWMRKKSNWVARLVGTSFWIFKRTNLSPWIIWYIKLSVESHLRLKTVNELYIAVMLPQRISGLTRIGKMIPPCSFVSYF